ncbi:hypothetical protein GCM10009753_52760 [Streptantibioticus ferralitis]
MTVDHGAAGDLGDGRSDGCRRGELPAVGTRSANSGANTYARMRISAASHAVVQRIESLQTERGGADTE